MPLRLIGRRRGPDPLGEGVWRRAHDRFRRAVDRYHQVLEQVAAGEARDSLDSTGTELATALDDVRVICLSAQHLAPSAGDDLPGGHGGIFLDVHRALTRASTLAAQAGEAVTLTLVALRAGQQAEAPLRARAAGRAADQARAQIERAKALLSSAGPRHGE